MTPEELSRRSQCDEIWASREVYADALNAERLARWEARKAAIFERDLPPSNPKPAIIEIAEVTELPRIARGSRK